MSLGKINRPIPRAAEEPVRLGTHPLQVHHRLAATGGQPAQILQQVRDSLPGSLVKVDGAGGPGGQAEPKWGAQDTNRDPGPEPNWCC